MHLLMQAICGDIWKFTPEKSHTNVTNAAMHLLTHKVWGSIPKFTLEKSWTNATNVTLLLLMQAIYGNILKFTLGKSQTNATNATMHLFGHAILEDIWKYICVNFEKSYMHVILHLLGDVLKFKILKLNLGKMYKWNQIWIFPLKHARSRYIWELTIPNISHFFTQPQFEAKKFYSGKCVSLSQKLSLDKTECTEFRLCVKLYTVFFFAFRLENFTLGLIFAKPAVVTNIKYETHYGQKSYTTSSVWEMNISYIIAATIPIIMQDWRK